MDTEREKRKNTGWTGSGEAEDSVQRLYGDILYREAPVIAGHPRQPLEMHAAQFSPFAALTGYEDAVMETARITEEESSLSEEALESLNQALLKLQEQLTGGNPEPPVIRICYFLPDRKKSGGQYCTVLAEVLKLCSSEHSIRIRVRENRADREDRRNTVNGEVLLIPFERIRALDIKE